MAEFIRLSTRDYVRSESGSAVQYRGDLGEGQSISYQRSLAFWPWGPVSGSLSAGVITINNRDGRYDQLIYRDLRDQPLSVVVPTEGGATASSSSGGTSTGTSANGEASGDIVVLTAIVDRIEAPSDQEVQVHLKDRLTLLDVPLQPNVFGDDADEGVVDRPLPILLGVARSIRPIVWEAEPSGEDGPALRIHDAPLSGLTNVRDEGVVLSPFSSPIGFKLDPRVGNAGIILGAEPDGVVTVDASSSGDAIIPPSTPDALDGDGAFSAPFDDANFSNPETIPGWTFFGSNPSAEQPFQNPDVESRSDSDGNYAWINGGASQSGRSILSSDNRVLEAGKSYRWEYELVEPVSFATVTGNNIIASQGTLTLRCSRQQETQDRRTPLYGFILDERATYGADNVRGTYSGIITLPEGATDYYVQVCLFNGGRAGVRNLTFKEIPPPPPDDLEGIGLLDYAVEIVRRAGMPTSLIDEDSINEIDPNEESFGFYADRPVTALAALRAPLNSFGADVYTDRDGRYKFARLRDVSGEIPSRLIDRNVIVRESNVLVYPDEAPGLTTSMLARKNWYVYRDSDFADSGTGLTLEQKEALKRDGRFIRTAVLPESEQAGSGTGTTGDDESDWPRLYRHAVNAEPLLSLFDEAEAAAAEIQRVADLYSVMRQFVEVDVWLDPGEFIDVNEVVEFVYPRYDFDEGKNMLVVGVSDVIEASGRRRMASIKLWG